MRKIDEMNLELYKSTFVSHKKLVRTILQKISSEELIKEIKRRKLVSFNWETNKYEKVEKNGDS